MPGKRRLRGFQLLVLLALVLGATAVPAGAQAGEGRDHRSGAARRDSARLWLDWLRRDPHRLSVASESVALGGRTVAAGERIDRDVVVFRGALDVRGTIAGNAVALGGDVILHPGSRVHGDAIAIGGQVRNSGGAVGGEMRSISRLAPPSPPVPSASAATPPARTPVEATGRALSLALGWFVVLAAIGVLVMLFARDKLETIAETIRDRFSRAFLIGALGEVALLPMLVLSIVALAVTVVGVLLIPFALVAYLLAAVGALALGFLAMAQLTGEAVSRRRAASLTAPPSETVRYVLVGLAFYLALWLLAAAFTWAGPFGAALRVVAGIVTWVAVTVGFGATLLSRAGTRIPGDLDAAEAVAEDYTWQTPTPVSGVAAARRPTPAPRP